MLLVVIGLAGVAAFASRFAVRQFQGIRHDPVEPKDDWWPVAFVLIAVSVVPLFVFARGSVMADTWFIFVANPQRLLAHTASIWQHSADLGSAVTVNPVLPTAYIALLRELGASLWLSQRIWFGTLLLMGSLGTAGVAWFFTKSRAAALVAGLMFLAAPYTFSYFYPTWLFVSAAALPLVVLAALHGTTSTSRWRWAAVAALLVTGAMFNLPAVALATLPVVAVLLYLRVSGRAGWRSILAWLGATAAFAGPILLPFALAFPLQVDKWRSFLAVSESFDAIAQSSSWSESIRGLGGWLVYWNPGSRLVLPYIGGYLTNWTVVVLTFVPVIAAFLVVALTRLRARLLFGAMLIGCTALMVGGYPRNAPSPLGLALTDVFNSVPLTFAFRSVFKAGAGTVLATAVLLGIGAAWFLGRRRSPPINTAAAVLAVAVVVAGSYPLWTGQLLRTVPQIHGDVPGYWQQALRDLDARRGSGRAMVVPLSDEDRYRWGNTTWGDMFASKLDRPVVLGGAFPDSSGDAGDLVQALARNLSSGHYAPGTFAPIARRLGISYLVIRNDLDWQDTGAVRPAALQPLRDDRTLQRVAAFGHRGQNTTRRGDRSQAAARERRLPPVEIYRVPGARGGARVVSDAPPLIVSGDGDAWPELAAARLLDDLGPVQYTGRLSDEQLRRALEAGATLVITDTNRRVLSAYGVPRETVDATVTDRVSDLFGRAGSQTIPLSGDATSVREVGPPRLFRPGLAHRPWAAFDGHLDTSWLTGNYLPPLGEYLEVDLARPRTISTITVHGAPRNGDRDAAAVRVSLDNGRWVTKKLGADHTASFAFSPRKVHRVRIGVTKVEGSGRGPYGLAEISIKGLNLKRALRVPDDVARVARRDPAIARSLSTAPIRFLFARDLDGSEPTLRRTFRVPVSRAFTGELTLQVEDQTPRAAVARLARGPSAPACRTDLVQLDGVPVGVRIEASADELLARKPVRARLCTASPLGAGVHTLVAADGIPVDRVELVTEGGRQPITAASLVSRTTSDGSAGATVRVGGSAPAWVISGQAMAAQWQARTGGHDLGSAVELDAQAAWALPRGRGRVVETSFGGQGVYRVAFWLSVVALILAGIVAIADPRIRIRGPGSRALGDPRPWNIALVAGAVAFAFAVGGAIQALVVLGTLIAMRKRWLSPPVVGLVGAGLLLLAVTDLVPPFGASLRPADPTWPLRHEHAHFFVLQGVVLLVACIVEFARRAIAADGSDLAHLEGRDSPDSTETNPAELPRISWHPLPPISWRPPIRWRPD
jgi:Alpha-(1->3)-arabinofuranosyltransferase/F5/8 type C domain